MDSEIGRLSKELARLHHSFLEIADQLDPDLRLKSGVCGEWSPKQVVNHLVGWDGSMLYLIVSTDDFDPPYDVDGFNTRSVLSRQALTWQESIEELESNFQELQEALTTVRPEMEIYRHVVGWLPGRIADYELHMGQLEAWL